MGFTHPNTKELRARIEELEAALKPFALMAYRFWSQRAADEEEHSIKQSDFERACKVLTKGDSQ
jgi:D-serine deaminase-like pyridoxal phosphate-dependent protein